MILHYKQSSASEKWHYIMASGLWLHFAVANILLSNRMLRYIRECTRLVILLVTLLKKYMSMSLKELTCIRIEIPIFKQKNIRQIVWSAYDLIECN